MRCLTLLFSKDRALQLDAALRSFMLHCKDAELYQIRVLYTTTTPLHEKLYRDLDREYLKYPCIQFVPERDFRGDLLTLLPQFDHVLFLVDDTIFVRDFLLSDIIKGLTNHPDALGFSLRLGRNTRYCYMLKKQQSLPEFISTGNSMLLYYWITAEHDFGYPLEVSSSVYRVKDILPFIARFPFTNPNILELEMSSNRSFFHNIKPFLLCYEQSAALSTPLNKVQTILPGNRTGSNAAYCIENLAELFEKGYRIDVGNYNNFVPNACHQEIELKFIAPTVRNDKAEVKVQVKEKATDTATIPLVSVIIPCYNQAHFLSEAIESIVNQTFRNWECIIVNDGSSDNTTGVANYLIAKYPDKNIKLIEKINGGLSDARNAGISKARGNWILPLDSDDMFAPDFLEKAFRIIERNPSVNLVTTNMQAFGSRPHEWIPNDYSPERILYENTFIYASLCKKELWESVGGYYPGLPWGAEDWNFWIACSRAGIVSVRIPERLFLYRTHSGASMYDKVMDHWDEVQAMIQTLHPDLYAQEKVLFAHNIISVMHPETIVRLDSIISRFPHLSMPFLWRGLYYEHIGKSKSALEDYKKSFGLSEQKNWQSFIRIKLLEENLPEDQTLQRGPPVAEALFPETIRTSGSTDPQATMNNQQNTAPPLHIVFCFISNRILPDGINGGLEIATLGIAKALAARGHRITVIAPLPTPDITWGGVRFIPLTDELEANFNKIFPDTDIFCAVSHASTFSHFNLPSSVVKAVHFHHYNLDFTLGSPEEKERVFKRDADIILCVSEFSRRQLIAFGVDKHIIHTVHNGLNTDIFYPDSSIRRSPHTILFVGAIDPDKRPDYAMNAVIILRRIIPDLTLLIVGSPELSGTEKTYIDIPAISRDYPFIQFLGTLSQDKLREEYCRASILIIPSRVESFGMASIEAQRCGCIPVVSDVGGLPETILPDETGVLVHNPSPERFAEVVQSLLMNEALLNIMRVKASEFALTFEWQNMAARTETLFTEAVRQKHAYKPHVSVIIPCYNYGHFLERAVKSVLTQTYKDFEIIIVNDGSTDNTQQVAENLIAANPDYHIRLIHQPNSGQPAKPRNNGVSRAKGEYILCLDADDSIAPDFLKECVAFLDKNPNISISIPSMQLFGDRNDYIPPAKYDFESLKHVNIMVTACVFRKKAWEEAGGYPTDIKGYEDWDFWISCGEHKHYAQTVPNAIFFYHVSGEGIGAKHVLDDQQIKAQIVLKHPLIYTPAQIRWAKGVLAKDPAMLAIQREGIIPSFAEQPTTETKALPINQNIGFKIVVAANLVPFKDRKQAKRQEACIKSISDLKSLGVVPLNICYKDECMSPSGWQVAPLLKRSANLELKIAGKRKPFVTDLFDIASEWAEKKGIPCFALSNSDIIFTPLLIRETQRLLNDGYETLVISRSDITGVDPVSKKPYGYITLHGSDVFICRTDWWKNNRSRFQPYIFGERAWDNAFASIMACHSKSHFLYIKGLCFHYKHRTNWLTGPYTEYNMAIYNGADSVYRNKYSYFIVEVMHMDRNLLTFDKTSELMKNFFENPDTENFQSQAGSVEHQLEGKNIDEDMERKVMDYINQADVYLANNDLPSARQVIKQALRYTSGHSQLSGMLSNILKNLESSENTGEISQDKSKR